MTNKFASIGYSGHAHSLIEIAISQNMIPVGYYDLKEKKYNPYDLDYLGQNHSTTRNELIFISIGDNLIRKNIYDKITNKPILELNIISPCSSVSKHIKIGNQNFIGRSSVVNSNVKIANGCIINSGCIIEHDCIINNFVHVAPGAVIAGGVCIGSGTLVGANSFIKENITIGKNVIIGAGSVVLRDIDDNKTVYGNPVKK